MLDTIQFNAIEFPLHQRQLFLVAGVADVFGVLQGLYAELHREEEHPVRRKPGP